MLRRISFLLACLCLFAAVAPAQTGTYNVLNSNGSGYRLYLRASDGNFYGVSNSTGAVISVTPSGVIAQVAKPAEEPVLCSEAPDGTLLGFTDGDQNNGPTLFKLTLGGKLTSLASFPISSSTASYMPGCPILASDGNLYGGAAVGGTYDSGYLYQLTSGGTLNVLYSFSGNFSLDGGEGPSGPLVQGSDGSFYGVATQQGGEQGTQGFRYSIADGLTLIADAYGLDAPLVEEADGNIYGMSYQGLYQVTPSVTQIWAPNSTLAPYLLQPVFMGGDGTLYVQQLISYPQSCGEGDGNYIQVQGVQTSGTAGPALFNIGTDESEGSQSDSYTLQMIEGGDGNFYGVASDSEYIPNQDGLCGGSGTTDIFSETFTPPLTPPVQMTLSATNVLPGKTSTLTWKVNNAWSDTLQQCYGYGGLSGAVGLTGSYTFAPAKAGVYTAAVVCGGTETGFAKVYAGVTTMGVSASPTTITPGVPVTLTATITNAGTPAPTGTVKFLYGTTVLGTAKVNAQGMATFSAPTTGLPPGTYKVTASYAGDGNYAPATAAAPATVTVEPRDSTTATLTTGSPTVYQGNKISFGMIVTSSNSAYPTPTGTVSLIYDGNALASMQMEGGFVIFYESTAGIPPGNYVVTASYGGDLWNAPSTSAPLTITVKTGDTVTVSASPNPVPAGDAFTLTSTVTSAGSPTGSVFFYAGTQELASSSLNSGVATVNVPTGTLAAGSYQVTAYYAGDSKNPTSTSPAITLTVQ